MIMHRVDRVLQLSLLLMGFVSVAKSIFTYQKMCFRVLQEAVQPLFLKLGVALGCPNPVLIGFAFGRALL